jgi:hypothetical protein
MRKVNLKAETPFEAWGAAILALIEELSKLKATEPKEE